jgi:lipoate-protein ligase A
VSPWRLTEYRRRDWAFARWNRNKPGCEQGLCAVLCECTVGHYWQAPEPFRRMQSHLPAKKDIHLVRRISGGGAVYHDEGNLNFSFITGFEKEKLDYFKKLIRPILKALRRLGVPAEITEKNNILVEGKKISGNSQYTNINRLLSHGTLLIDSDLNALRSALQSKAKVIHSKNDLRATYLNRRYDTARGDDIALG